MTFNLILITGVERHRKIILQWYGTLSKRGPTTGHNSHRGHPLYDVRTEGVRLRWTDVDGGRGVKPHVDVHTEN